MAWTGSADVQSQLAQIHYWIRERYLGSALQRLDEFGQQHQQQGGDGAEWHCRLLRAFCIAKLGRPAEAIRLLNALQKDSSASEFRLAVLHGLRIAHASEANIDKESVRELDRQIQSLWMQSTEQGAYTAASLLLLDRQYERARPLVDRLNSQSNSTFLSMRGWLEMLSGKGVDLGQELFDRAIELDKCVDAFFGKAKLHEIRQNAGEMQSTLGALLNANASVLPAYVEMAKASAMVRNWDAVTELCQRAALIQSDCLPSLLFEFVLVSLIRGDSHTGEQILAELVDSLLQVEGANQRILLQTGELLATLMVDRKEIAQQTRKLCERALSLTQNARVWLLKSRILLAEGDSRQALQMALKAVESGDEGEHGEQAVFAVIRAQLEEGGAKDVKEARQQLDFVREAHPNVAEHSHFHYLLALLAKAEQKPPETVFELLRVCTDVHFTAHHRVAFSLDHLVNLDLHFCVQIAEQLLKLADSFAVGAALREAERVLVAVHECTPGLTKPTFLLAKAKLFSGDIASAEQLLRSCVDRSSDNADTYLLLAQIHVQKGELDDASKLLDIGLGFNFRVREHPLYFLTKARLEKRAHRVDQSIELLRNALDLFAKKQAELGLVESERIAITLELIDSLQSANRIGEADACMAEAVERYRGNQAEEQQLVLMNAQLRLQRGNVDGALKALQAVRADQPNYRAARIKMAQIYLEEKHDKHRFALCYRDLLEQDPSPHTYEMLGDAYISIQEPELAIEAYETAMRRAPKDHQLAEKIGNAYVKCHLYNKAITFYEAAMKSGRQNILRIRFAEQLFQMGNFEKCKKVLREVLDADSEPSDVAVIREHVSYCMLMSRLHIETNEWEQACRDLLRARQLQLKIIARGAGSEGINVAEEKRLAGTICQQLAEMHANTRNWNKAIDLFKEAIGHNERDIKSQLSLAGIYASVGKMQLCNQQCQQVLAIDPNNNDATLLLADMMYQRNEGEEAMKHFAQLLERNPNHYHALARYIELGWRQGSIETGDKMLRNALESNPRATVDAGFNFCKGLIEWYTGEPNSALQAFNRARRDLEWGERALYNMIEICLNPDNEIMGAEVSEPMTAEEANEASESHKAADRFFRELRHKSMLDQRYKLVENFILLASPNKANVHQALSNFLDMCRTDGSTEGEANLSVGAILGSSRAFLMLKQTQKAKVQLKRVLSHTWNLDEADYLQQSWLLLADVYINQGKNEQATNVLRTVLQHNASCSKAYEYMGFICEREQKYIDAAANYEAAWNVCKRRNPAIGYKLAYNYFKCHRLFDCIEVCHAVLKQYPTYPKIKKEILDKARANIRM